MFFLQVYGTETLLKLPNECISSVNAAYLNTHNIFRKLHGVADFKENASLIAYAQDWANYLAVNDFLKNNLTSNRQIGVNLAFSSYSPEKLDLNDCGSQLIILIFIIIKL